LDRAKLDYSLGFVKIFWGSSFWIHWENREAAFGDPAIQKAPHPPLSRLIYLIFIPFLENAL